MMASEFKDKHVLITGGTRGIGFALAERLATEGAKLSLTFHTREEDAAKAVSSIQQQGGSAAAFGGDVACPDETARVVEEARSKFGPVDMLVTSAGVSFPMPAEEVTWKEWKRTLDVNLDGTFNYVYAVKDEMIARNFGRIVTVSSIAGLRERCQQLPYSVSKAGVIALTRCAAEGWGKFNIRVNCVCPGLTETELAHTLTDEDHKRIVAATPLGRIGEPHEIAALARFLLSEESSYSTGQTFVASGGRVMRLVRSPEASLVGSHPSHSSATNQLKSEAESGDEA
jgi:3-oxoacyl-[acyl-carrier protein] reductase